MVARIKHGSLVYLRRSGNRQEHSLRAQLEWALQEAERQGIALDASLDDLDLMRERGLSQYKSIYLDDAISGSEMNRPGFQALVGRCQRDNSQSHVFVYKRDRLGRPEDAFEMASLEKKLRLQGVTIIMSHKMLPPLDRGLAAIGDDMEAYFEYYESGEFLRKLAERTIGAVEMLARQGFRTGGNPPYGFVRVLVDANGNVLEELAPGKTVRQAGCHVRIKPKDEEKLRTWVHILDLKHRGWGNKRIAQHLTDMGIPSPNAGRVRTDQGKPHRISSKWNHRTVAELCSNAAILGLQEYGNRAEGKFFRHGESGPRRVDDRDRHGDDGRPKVTKNDRSLVISVETGFGSQYDPKKWQEIQARVQARGAKQQGVPKVREPGKYPLSCRLVDLTDNCGSILYARENGKRRMYVCGRYMRTSGAECENNAVDAEAILRVTVESLCQLMQFGGAEDKLRARLAAMTAAAPANAVAKQVEAQIAKALRQREKALQQQETVGRRMATESDDDRYRAISARFDELTAELKQVDQQLRALHAQQTVEPPAAEVDHAVVLYRKLEGILTDPGRRAELAEAFEMLGVRIGLNFGAGMKKTRVTRQLLGGLLAFDDRDLPVRLHGELGLDGVEAVNTASDGAEMTVAKEEEVPRESEGGNSAGNPERRPLGTMKGRREGVSFTKGSRGDRTPVELFLVGLASWDGPTACLLA